MQPQTTDNWLALVQEHFIAVFTFDLGRYLVAAGLLTIILWLAHRWSEARRIQSRRAKRQDYLREISSSIRTVFFFGVTGLTTVLMIEAGLVYLQLDLVPAWVFALQLAAIIVAHDAYFYWMHRALHHKSVFRLMHLHHHKSRTPTPWAAYSFSAFEAVTEAAFMPIFLLATSTMGIAYGGTVVFVFLAWMIIRNAIGHSGVEIHPAGWVDTPWLDWLTTTTHHDLHHSEGRHNFGLYFTWWDRMMGTEHPRYKEEFRRVAKPIQIARRPAEVISVSAMAVFASVMTLSSGLGVMGAIPA
ncbi:sterol desaturase family protein [Altererythrobacter sp. MF3-039]|uniref:sterol desaturase family protein n=1 Tax=Altererythrobacter sp. MF3-039 TaxID=3252901 RepID=UPI00390CBFE9